MHQKYKKTLNGGDDGPESSVSSNRVRWTSPNRALRAVIRTRSSREMTLYSRNAGPGYSFFGRLLHSIPNKKSLGNKQLRCLSYSIPLVCMLVLFGLFCVAGSIGSEFSNEAYAEEGDGNSDEEGKLSAAISGDLEQTTPAVAGEMAYRSHNIRVNGTNIDNYTMQISYSSGSSTLENTPMLEGAEPTAISGANGRTSSSADDNWWGYSWDDNDKAEDTLTFQTMPQYGNGTQLEGGKPTDGTVSVDKTLTFAAKFGSDTAAGHYKADVLLSLAASPKKIVSEGLGSIEYMQDVTPELCAKTPIWTEENRAVYTLTDNRGDKVNYTVARLVDGNCWMTENLKLPGGTTITTEDSDLNPGSFVVSASSPSIAGTTSYTLPNSSTSGFSSDTTHNMYMSPTEAYGGYYTWCTATAGCRKENGANPGANENADSSICPKGWKLPLSGSVNASISGSFANLLAKANIPVIGGSPALQGVPYNFQLGGGYINDSPSGGIGNAGHYWSGTASSTTHAYYFNTANASSTLDVKRSYGFSVRCVAEAPSGFGGVYAMQDMTADVCSKVDNDTTGTLIDRRDNKIYSVAKFRDGNCWMTENLQIIDKTLTSTDSDLPAGTEFVLPATSTKADFKSANVNTKQVYSGSDSVNNTVYYNWYTATAGTGNASVTTNGVSVTSSICPKGWELPTGGGGGQFQKLADVIGTSTSIWRSAPYNFVATGYVRDDTLDETSVSYYWSRTSGSGAVAGYLYMGSSGVGPQNGGSRYDGFAVRCVAQTTANKQY